MCPLILGETPGFSLFVSNDVIFDDFGLCGEHLAAHDTGLRLAEACFGRPSPENPGRDTRTRWRLTGQGAEETGRVA